MAVLVFRLSDSTVSDLRRHARMLENQIDLKLVALNKLTSGAAGNVSCTKLLMVDGYRGSF